MRPIVLFALAAALPLAAQTKNSAAPFDPHDLSGRWDRTSRFEAYANVPGSGGRGAVVEEAPLTAAGRAALEKNIPGVGPRAWDPRTSRRNNDPMDTCDPMGVPRILNVEIVAPHNTMDIVQLRDRTLEFFNWHHDWREVWTDGRQLPKTDDLEPKWNGYSVGRWDGDTFIVDSIGFDERTWLDRYGYPHTEDMRLQERYRRVAADTLEFTMTLTDPKYYSKPWMSDQKVFKLNRENGKEWDDQAYCVPSVELQFNQLIRDGGFGQQK